MDKDALLALLREHLTVSVAIGQPDYANGIKVTVTLAFDGELIDTDHDTVSENPFST